MENRRIEIAKFYRQIFLDTKIKELLEKKAKKIINEEDFKKLIREEIIPLMKKFKVNFSEEDLLNYEKETLKNLSQEDLENVSGGASPKAGLLTGGLLSIVLLGGAGLSANAMNDEISTLPEQKQIIQTSSNNDKRDKTSKEDAKGNNGKSEEKVFVTESPEKGGADVSAFEIGSPEAEPPKVSTSEAEPPKESTSEEETPETNKDTETARLKKDFIKELLKHNVDLVSLYDKKSDGSFNDDVIAGKINALLSDIDPKTKISIEGVNLDQTNCDATTKCIKLATEFGKTDVTFDEIRMFNLEKIRRAYGRNMYRHLAGSWEAFNGQRFAGILSYKYSLLDLNKELDISRVKVYNETIKENEKIDGLVQKLTVKTPFGESDLWVYYYIDNDVLVENNRMIRYLGDDEKMHDVSYEQIMKSFNLLGDDNKKKILQAILDYLSIKADQYDIDNLNSGNKTPLDVFNDKVNPCKDINLGYQKKGDMSDFASILMFCENSFNRVMAGGKWERAFLDAAKNYLEANLGKKSKAIDAVIKGYWLHVATGSEIPPARIFSEKATKTNWNLAELQNWIGGEWYKHTVDVVKKVESLNALDLSSSSDEENQEQAVNAVEHTVISAVLTGGNSYKLSHEVVCDNGVNPCDLIKTKYGYLKPTVLALDGENVPEQPSSSVSATASDTEGADKK